MWPSQRKVILEDGSVFMSCLDYGFFFFFNIQDECDILPVRCVQMLVLVTRPGTQWEVAQSRWGLPCKCHFSFPTQWSRKAPSILRLVLVTKCWGSSCFVFYFEGENIWLSKKLSCLLEVDFENEVVLLPKNEILKKGKRWVKQFITKVLGFSSCLTQ